MKRSLPAALAAVLFLAATAQAQTWQSCTMPTALMLNMEVGPSGELFTVSGNATFVPYVSTDQGATWTPKAGTGLSAGITDMRVSITNTGTLLVQGTGPQGSRVWRSTDAGNTFTAIGSGGGVPSSFYAFGMATGRTTGEHYLFGEGVLRTTDDGLTWTQIVPSNLEVHSVAATATSLIGAAYGGVFKCAHDGSGYAMLTIAPLSLNPVWDVSVGYNDRIVVVGGTFNKAITSTDDGVTWTDAGAQLWNPTEMQHVACSPLLDSWFVGKQNNMYMGGGGQPNVAANTGINWIGNEPLLGILVDPAGVFYMYTYSQIRKQQLSVGVNTSDAPTPGVFPNPATDELLAPLAAGRTYRLIDLQGRTLAQGVVPFGGRIGIGGLASGTYLIAVEGFAPQRVEKL